MLAAQLEEKKYASKAFFHFSSKLIVSLLNLLLLFLLLQAKKFYESALRLEPGYLGAALALAELHVIEGRNGDAVSLLERYLKDWADDSLHVKLAQVFAATNMLQDALLHYQAALRLPSFPELNRTNLRLLVSFQRNPLSMSQYLFLQYARFYCISGLIPKMKLQKKD